MARAAAGRRPSRVTLLLAEIARAMQAAAAQERERIHAGVGEDEGAQIEKVRARATAEAAALRKDADDDVRLVQSWCDEEIRRIRLEAERRIAERRTELDQSVTQHGSLIETEVQSVHGASQATGNRSTRSSPDWPRRATRARSRAWPGPYPIRPTSTRSGPMPVRAR